MSEGQVELDAFVSETPTGTISTARTVRCKLETSQTKNEILRRAIDDWQHVAREMSNYMPTFPPHLWSGHYTGMTRLARREFTDINIYAHDRNEAVNKVREAFHSWDSNGRVGAHPRGQFGDSNYMRICSCCDRLDVVENERGIGVRLKLIKREDPVWFHVNAGEYQREYLHGVVDDDYGTGDAEVHLTDDGEAYLHLTVTRDVEVYEQSAVPRFVGVDVGERVLYALATIKQEDDGDSYTVLNADMKSGRKFRHHRERLKRKRDRLQEQDDLRGVREISGERERYTDHVLGTASREIVDTAREYAPCAIVLEDMTDYRETAADPIHDFPYADLQDRIAYKATDEGIPVVSVDPANTSITCRQCGATNPEFRDGDTFNCWDCGYEIHADVNAAINIARSML